MYAEERHEAIATLVRQRGRVSVTDLAQTFEVTSETVRRDLDSLERAGLLRRVHGGAVPVAALTRRERTLRERDGVRVEQKDRIAQAAIGLLPEAGGSVILDAGTTTARAAMRFPVDSRLTVLTNSLTCASTLISLGGIQLEMLGGRVRETTQACVGDRTVREIDTLRADVVFLGANGFSPDGGLTTPDAEEAAVKRALVTAAHRVVLLADSSKFGRDYLVRFAHLTDIDVLVTDDEIDREQLGQLTAAGVEVLLG